MDDPEPKREGGRAARRASDTHQRLLQAALSVFNESGVDGCAIEDITEKADVGKGTFYRHFRDKFAILTNLIERSVNDIEARIIPPSPAPLSLENTLAKIVRAHLAMFQERRDLFLLFLQAHSMMAARGSSLPDLHPAMNRYWAVIETQIKGPLASHAPNSSPRLVASAVSGSILGMIMTDLSTRTEAINNDQVESICNAIVAGIVQHLR